MGTVGMTMAGGRERGLGPGLGSGAELLGQEALGIGTLLGGLRPCWCHPLVSPPSVTPRCPGTLLGREQGAWGGKWEVVGHGAVGHQAMGRQQNVNGKSMGNERGSNGVPMGQQWEVIGELMGCQWGINGESLGQQWEVNGAAMGYL